MGQDRAPCAHGHMHQMRHERMLLGSLTALRMRLAWVSVLRRLHAADAPQVTARNGGKGPLPNRSWLYSEFVGKLLTTRTVVLLWILAAWLTAGAVWAAAGLSPGVTRGKLIAEILAAVLVAGS